MFRVLITLIMFFSLCTSGQAIEEKKMKVVFAQEFMPFSWKDDKGQIRGVLIDFLNEIIDKRMGIPLQFDVYPWARAQFMVKNGLSDAFFTIPNPKRKTYAEVSQIPFFTSDFILFTGAANPKYKQLIKIKTLEELKQNNDFRHIYILGGGWHEKNLAGVHYAKHVTNSTMILKYLTNNVADVYIEQSILVNYQIRLLNYQSKIIEIPTVMDSTSWHLCIGKKSSFVNIMPEVNQLILRLKKEGTLEKIQSEIFNKYKP